MKLALIEPSGPCIELRTFECATSDTGASFLSGLASELSRYLGPTSAAWFRSLAWRSGMSGNIFNSNGTHVGVVDGSAIFDLKGKKLYHLKGTNIYRLSGELVGHLNGAQGSDKRLDRSTDKLFPAGGS